MADEKVYFSPQSVHRVGIKVQNTENSSHQSTLPTTQIGREALRNFQIDYDSLNRAFRKAMKK